MIACCFVVPMVLVGIRRLRTIPGVAIASLAVVVGMWLERFLIIVPTLANPRLPFVRGGYTPRWPEITITIGTFAYFGLLYLLFTKFFPIISLWEIKEGLHSHPAAARSSAPPRPAPAAHPAGGVS
jgi:molybdopterin-containing oxidoreductase family membrane subunit